MGREEPRHGDPVRFRPLRPVTSPGRVALWICGPLLWLVGLVVVAHVVREGQAVGVGLGVLAVSFVLSLAWLLIARRLVQRKTGEPPPCA